MIKKLFKTHCYMCKKPITVLTKNLVYNVFTCNDCIPENSPIRNNIDEAMDTEIKMK